MNARECMQALLDGKTVEFTMRKLKLDENGTILAMWHHNECHDTEWHAADMLMNNPNFKIVEEYPLTFEEALKEMLSGKKVENDCSFEYYRFFDGTFKCYNYDLDIGWDEVELSPVIQKMKWKVVE